MNPYDGPGLDEQLALEEEAEANEARLALVLIEGDYIVKGINAMAGEIGKARKSINAAGASPAGSGAVAPAPAAAAEADGALIVVANGDQNGLAKVFRGTGAEFSSFDTRFDPNSDVAAGNFVGGRVDLELVVVDGIGGSASST